MVVMQVYIGWTHSNQSANDMGHKLYQLMYSASGFMAVNHTSPSGLEVYYIKAGAELMEAKTEGYMYNIISNKFNSDIINL